MKITVLGATGKTGQEVVEQGVQEGHTVTAIVRDPAKITTTHDNLKVVKGDIFDANSLSPTLEGQDAVVSCLGFNRNPQPVTGYTESMKALVSAMRHSGVSRLVTMSAWYSDTSTGDKMGFFVKWMLIPFLRPILTNMFEMEKFLSSECSDINYTVVRPPGLGNNPKTGKEMSVSEDYFVNTGTFRNLTNRADVASFMLSCLKTNDYDRKMVAITTTPKIQE